MQRWLTTPHVLEWWGKPGPTLQQVEARYLPRILGKEPTDCYVVIEGDRDIGFIQTYNIANYPEYHALAGKSESRNCELGNFPTDLPCAQDVREVGDGARHPLLRVERPPTGRHWPVASSRAQLLIV